MPAGERLNLHRAAHIVIVVLYLIYAAAFIYRSSFVIDGQRYFCLFDDAMVSMRYAENLAAGHGLVWNEGGEKVEGYTNLLWVIFMAACHLLPVARAKICLAVQIPAVLLVVLNLVYVKRIAEHLAPSARLVSLSAVLLTACYLPLNTWSMLGTEVSLLTLAVCMAVYYVLRHSEQQQLPWAAYLLIGVATLIRVDAAVPMMAILLFGYLMNRSIRHLAIGALTVLVFLAAHALFRRLYYGEWVPNTYFLKMVGFPAGWRLARGMIVLWAFLWESNVALVIFALLALAARQSGRFLLGGLVVLQAAYSVYVGGDAWEWWPGSNRFISIVMPLFFVLYGCALLQLRDLLRGRLARLPTAARRAWGPRLEHVLVILLLSLGIIGFNGLHDDSRLQEWLTLKPLPFTELNHTNVTRGLWVKDITEPQATLAVCWAGAPPYFAERRAIDMLGKSDRHIARQKMHPPPPGQHYTWFLPGHLKWDYAYSIGVLQPDVIEGLYRLWNVSDAAPYLEPDYSAVGLHGRQVYLLNDSTHILWPRVTRHSGTAADPS